MFRLYRNRTSSLSSLKLLETISEADEEHNNNYNYNNNNNNSYDLEMTFDSDEQYTPPLNPTPTPTTQSLKLNHPHQHPQHLLLHMPPTTTQQLQQKQSKLEMSQLDNNVDMLSSSSCSSSSSSNNSSPRSPDTSNINLYGFHRLSLDLFPLCPGLYSAFIRGDEFETSLTSTLLLCIKLKELKNRLFNKQSNSNLTLSISNLKFKAEYIQINKLHISEICSMCLEITQLMSYVDPLFRHKLDQRCLQSYLNMIIQIIVSIEQRLKQLLKRNGCKLVKKQTGDDQSQAWSDSCDDETKKKEGGGPAFHSSPLRNGSTAHHPYRRKYKPVPGPCVRCEATETPEWRKGPDGQRNLCNACGLKYKKDLAKLRRREMETMSIHNMVTNPKSTSNSNSNTNTNTKTQVMT
ncbi:hypothetical protein SAMD00019534_115610, partial [Acytostelium subglobosum LB1]|uniref:hypothetical protein n=1 Tax=Acytostelium subglobosum LB1 TaxID=1410327 RepID=UPI00064506CC